MKDWVRVALDPGRSARPGLVLLALGSPRPLGCPTAGSLFLLFLKSLARPAELQEGITAVWLVLEGVNVNQKDGWDMLATVL